MFIKVASQKAFQNCVTDSTDTVRFRDGFCRSQSNGSIPFSSPAQQAGECIGFSALCARNLQGGRIGCVHSPKAANPDGKCPFPDSGCSDNLFLSPKCSHFRLPWAASASSFPKAAAVQQLCFSFMPSPSLPPCQSSEGSTHFLAGLRCTQVSAQIQVPQQLCNARGSSREVVGHIGGCCISTAPPSCGAPKREIT